MAVQADTTADANLARQLHQQELYELRQRSRPKREWKQVYNTEISLLSDDEDIDPPLAKKQKQKQKQKKKPTNSSDDEEWLPKKLQKSKAEPSGSFCYLDRILIVSS